MIRHMVALLLLAANCGYVASAQESAYFPMFGAAVENRDSSFRVAPHGDMIIIKRLAYDKYTLDDKYMYGNTERGFQWDKITAGLVFLDSVQRQQINWGIIENYKNANGETEVVKDFIRDEYNMVSDRYRVQRYQSAALFSPDDMSAPVRYARDGTLVRIIERANTDSLKVEAMFFDGEWMVHARYVKPLPDTLNFTKVIFVDRLNQNIATLEKGNSPNLWFVRSMNPCTTGAHKPPHQLPTPLGIFVIIEHKEKMIFLVDGTSRIAGYSPFASRFSGGAYIHGVPVSLPATSIIEYSWSLGTIPRSHMCVRNATSHAEYIYNWGTPKETLVFVLE